MKIFSRAETNTSSDGWVSDGAEFDQPSDGVLVQSVLTGRVVQGGGGGDRQVWVEVQVGGAGQGALRRAARRLLRADEVVVVVMVVMVEVMVAVGVGGVPQGEDVSPAGRQGGLRRGQVGAGAPHRDGLPGQWGQNHRVRVEQRGGCSLEDELGALDALILITLRTHTALISIKQQETLILLQLTAFVPFTIKDLDSLQCVCLY